MEAKSFTAENTVTLLHEEKKDAKEEKLVLQLEPRKHIKWDESVVDNEHMGKKSSKRCCIFHKRRQFGESSTESSDCSEKDDDSDTDEDEDGEDTNGKRKADMKADKKKKNKKGVLKQHKNPKYPSYQKFHA
mmetsp:Transcript_10829/g.14065  ORF Transcript_10829/g.14065 Transcript_10829/m.14065 type:complete len:132 (+) Transcript_10829:183-578(+)|eukprot:CAMPEP_0117753756 /NCGR_PEP_ID=MMETSP0947-20121206/12421_1 /TAXON_ID=44440 /ORGANISM="Chattonella subsalsa, Strain CCMP2191" /LENGTH=131 /DNA_ID=CAMNT_0005572711 /DNA_START=177 /DNA_END=572 /DNA_ORIENTATION=+